MSSIRLLTSTIPKENYQEVIKKSKPDCSIEILEHTPTSMRLVISEGQNLLKGTLELNIANMPSFLTKYVETVREHILLCSQLNVMKPVAPYNQDKTLSLILSLKYFLKCLDKLYRYSSQKGTSGLLFVITSDQISFFSPMEELISYTETFMSHGGKKTMVFMPTDRASCDFFADFQVDFLKHLDQLLWSQQRASSLIRHYLKMTALTQ